MNKNKIVSFFILTGLCIPNFFNAVHAGSHKALCSFYSSYQPCEIKISNTHIEANLPTDYLYVDESNFLDLKVYEDLSNSSNLIVGTVTTLALGPIGLLGFLAKKKSGTVDYGVSFENDRGIKKTAFIRFVNMKAAANMAEELPSLLNNINRNSINDKGNL